MTAMRSRSTFQSIPRYQTEEEEKKERGEKRRAVKKMSKKIASSSRGKKYKLKTRLYPVLFTTDSHIGKQKMQRLKMKSAPALTRIHTYN